MLRPFSQNIVTEGRDDPDMQDQICKIYNNAWGNITQTCMRWEENYQAYIITGDFWKDEEAAEKLLYSRYWRNYTVDFKKMTGYNCLSDMLYSFGLQGYLYGARGEMALRTRTYEGSICLTGCDNYYVTSESKIPQPIKSISLNIKSLCSSHLPISTVLEALGEGWSFNNDKLIYGSKTHNIIVGVQVGEAKKIDDKELATLLDREGIPELYLVQYPKFFKVDSDDRIWKNVLKNNKYNNIPAKSFNDYKKEEWIEAIKSILNTIN